MGSPWLTAFAQTSPFAEAFASIGQGRSEGQQVPRRTRRVCRSRSGRPSCGALVSDQISLILRRSIDPDRPLSEYGLDSLGNLEVRTRIETETGVRISPADITTVRALAAHICEKLAAQTDVEAGS